MHFHPKRALLLFLLFQLYQRLPAQIDTLFVCNPGDPIPLNAPVGQFEYEWDPSEALDNPFIVNPIARPLVTTTFIATMIPGRIGANLIQNPDFSAGNTGFTSDYPFVESINTQGVYGINESAANLNPVYFADCPDHTDGSGKMMVIDGSPVANEKVWCQTIAVMPGTNYAFSAWLTSVNPNNPAALRFSINGAPLGSEFRAGANVCDWRQFYVVWNAGSAVAAEICIVNQNTNPNGNDFALDDFGFFELDAIRYDTTVVVVEALAAAKERRAYFPNAFSPNFDGINDVFLPFLGKGVLELVDFKIFDRWGGLLFEKKNCNPNDRACAWDGTLNGEPLPTGVYVYFSTLLFADQEVEIAKGDLWLIR